MVGNTKLSASIDEARRRILEFRSNEDTELNLSELGLSTVPSEIFTLEGLHSLDLSSNQLTALLPEFETLKDLDNLNLRGNQFTTFPPELFALKRMTTLRLDGNRLTDLPPEIAVLTSLRVLTLRNNRITALPSEIAALTSLFNLDLGQNELDHFPPEISEFEKLFSLNLSGNKLTNLPPSIGSLSELMFLELMDNRLTVLPKEIGNLRDLRTLDLDRNLLKELPLEVTELTTLAALYLQQNELISLPTDIKALRNLKNLWLSDNRLTALPPEIGECTKLEGLRIENNKLKALPTEMSALTKLKELLIDGNDFPRSYSDALQDDISNLFSLLRSLEKETTRLYEAKLLVTGEGQVGKSWTLAALRNQSPKDVVGDENTTWGIDRGELVLSHPKEPQKEIHLNTWDFGGQQVYRVTHQFFFSEQALFLLVWNPRKGTTQCRVREWLRTIALRTGSDVPAGAPQGTKPKPRAKVIMVATHAKAEGGNYNPEYGYDSLEPDLQAMIVDSIEVDNELGYNTEKLRNMVARHAAELPDMGSSFNKQWAAARDAVLAQRNDHPWITFGRFAEICAEHGVNEVSDLKTLAGTFMNRLGRAVWYGPNAKEGAGERFQKVDDLLEDTFVLDAVWLSRAFVQVLEDTPTRDSGGMLDHRRFRSIWTDHGRSEWYRYSPDEYQRITRMMRRFDVALPTRASDGERSLVPQLVPAIRPALPWTAPQDATGQRMVRLACQLDHKAEGLMARFIAATEPYHCYEERRGLFWQEGVFLRDSSSFENEAIVTVEGSEKPFVSILVSGDQPGFLVNELHRALESVMDFWKGMTRTYYIFCPTVDNDGGYCSGQFKLETVQRRSRKASSHNLDCQDCDEELTPDTLLHGLKAVRAHTETERQLAYLYHNKKIPCPRTFMLRPADPRWHKITSWSRFAGQRFTITLVSELSGKEVCSEEFTIKKEWTRWIAPLTRIASIALTGLAVPLDGEIALQLSEGAAAMDKLASLPPEDGDPAPIESTNEAKKSQKTSQITETQIHQLNLLLNSIGLDPRDKGMELAETRDGRWLWMTVEEAISHDRPEARLLTSS